MDRTSLIISKTPYRLSLLGGGTDYPSYYKDSEGAVLAGSINKYCYIMLRVLPPFFDYKYHVAYSEIERCKEISEIRHPAVREIIKLSEIDEGIDLRHAGDLPARAGMGTSSAFVVSLINALWTLKNTSLSKMDIAKMSIYAEQELLKERVGSQDQTTSAIGGFNRLDFSWDDGTDVKVTPIKNAEFIEQYLMLFFTGLSRTSSSIVKTQIERTNENKPMLRYMYELVCSGQRAIEHSNINELSRLLGESWSIKKRLSPDVSTDYIDFIYDKAIKAGAMSGKLNGGGGGGFMTFLVEPDKQDSVRNALSKLVYVPVKFEYEGTQIIYGKTRR